MPKTVIAIPIYNGEEFLKRTLNSCINQTTPTEVWVVNNCSTDKTEEITNEFSNKYPFIKLINNENNLGRMGNWNRCLDLLEESDFDYIKYLFAGDELYPNCIEECDKAMSIDPEIGAMVFNYDFVHTNGTTKLARDPQYAGKLFSIKEISTINYSKGGILGAIISNVYAKKYTKGVRYHNDFVTKVDFDIKVLSKSKGYHLDKNLAAFNLDCHRTYEKSHSSWCFFEVSYAESRLLYDEKELFNETEKQKIQEDIIMNSFNYQLPYIRIRAWPRFIWALINAYVKKGRITIIKITKAILGKRLSKIVKSNLNI
jgi:glycosyltransferase involved in cell wall biosynthesis